MSTKKISAQFYFPLLLLLWKFHIVGFDHIHHLSILPRAFLTVPVTWNAKSITHFWLYVIVALCNNDGNFFFHLEIKHGIKRWLCMESTRGGLMMTNLGYSFEFIKIDKNPSSWAHLEEPFLDWIIWVQKIHPQNGPHLLFATSLKWQGRRKLLLSSACPHLVW